ncbi:MAG: 5-formyltetrahydrofolate cyclo-ligase [Hyphomicrobium sp.]|nr:5-formyltetrahydrofolate cyclo-ligase [Hyphomicrobium sp.]
MTETATETELVAAKKALRTDMKAVRDRAAGRHGREAARAIAGHGIGFAGAAAPAWVTAFLPIGAEIDPFPLIERLIQEGYGIALPVMEAKGRPLVFRAWKPGEPLGEVQWGIREPLPSAPVVEPDVILGPLLAFDREGYRLGYGGGFYDRTLARLRALKPVIAIGLAFDEQRVDAVPHAHYDERLDWVLTQSGPTRFPSPRERG